MESFDDRSLATYPGPISSIKRSPSDGLLLNTQREPICRFCNNLNPRGHVNTTFDEGRARLELKIRHVFMQADSQSCQFCSMLVKIRRRFGEESSHSHDGTCIYVITLVEGGPGLLDVWWGGKKYKEGIVFFPLTGRTSAALPGIVRNSLIPDHLGSQATYVNIKALMNHCFSAHGRRCGHDQTAALPLLPKRVLAFNEYPRIVLLEGHNRRGRYITLSYLWGKSQPLKATSDNYEILKRGVPYEQLPAAFRDAITVCRELGVENLWIDALCIIQGDKPDWEAESAKMGTYFRNSYLTIAASVSGSPIEPFLVERHNMWEIEDFKLRNPDGSFSEICAKRRVNPLDVRTNAPTFSRGWIFQEHVLSHRIVHFVQPSIIWECRTEVIWEDGSKHWRKDPFLKGLGYEMDNKDRSREPADLSQIVPAIEHKGPFHAWHRLVESSSWRNLSFDSDKLPAMSSIAGDIARVTGSKYLAGLWDSHLYTDLLWGPVRSVNFRCENSSPSWSWASIDGPVKFRNGLSLPDLEMDALRKNGGVQSLMHVLDAHCEIPGANPYGEVSSGYLTLAGFLIHALLEVTINPGLNVEDFSLFGHDLEPIKFQPDARLGPVSSDHVRIGPPVSVERVFREDQSSWSGTIPVVLYLVARGEGTVYSLVLASQPTGDIRSLGYVRIGLVYFENFKPSDKKWLRRAQPGSIIIY